MRTDFFAALLGTASVCSIPAFTQTDTTFTYQGELIDSGNAASGSYSMDFTLFNALAGGSQIGSTVTIAAQAVSDGIFSAQLDFGPQDFSDTQFWLEIVVDGNTLSPRIAMTASPFSIQTRGIFVDGSDNVGIGTTNPGYPLHVEVASSSGRAIYSRANSPIGLTYGGWFLNDSSSGRAVFAQANAAAGTTYGVYGQSQSTSGRGIYGLANAATGTTYGVYGLNQSTSGHGVYGSAFASTGTTYGVRGKTNSEDGYAGFFEGGRNYFEGNVGIGTSSPISKLEVRVPSSVHQNPLTFVAGEIMSLRIYSNGGVVFGGGSAEIGPGNVHIAKKLGIKTLNPAFDISVEGTAGKTGGGSWAVFSDQRLKKNIVSVTGSLDTISALRPVNFEYTAKDHFSYTPGLQSGFVAQEVQQVIPQWVNTAEDGYFYLDQKGYEALIVDAIQELRAEKDAEIEKLRAEKGNQIQQLRARLDRLERMISLSIDR